MSFPTHEVAHERSQEVRGLSMDFQSAGADFSPSPLAELLTVIIVNRV